ncbi:hypothetical protein OG462_36160 [Streptomyces sp. NBC_01077]|uniref:hypothetical protein n=1 Tax=Streptomyces sp. NBC_01077 TaxID=2903746 RepID=UPI00386E29EB|nr:hypothetical protein OG462_36160 [Streptomyces sp. NBC_01077]
MSCGAGPVADFAPREQVARQAAWARVSASGEQWWDRYGSIEKWGGKGTDFQRSLEVKFPNPGSDWTNMLGSPTAYYRVCVRDTATDLVDCSVFW